MVYQVIGLKKSYRQVALELNVDVYTVQQTLKLFAQTGCIQKRKHPPNIDNTKITEFAKVFLVSLVIERPGVYLHEVKQLLLEYTGIDVQESTICKVLKACGLSWQNMTLAANQRSELLRSQCLPTKDTLISLCLLMKWGVIEVTDIKVMCMVLKERHQ